MSATPVGTARAVDCDVAVVGAGIVGLAVAREVQRRRPDAVVAVLDKEAEPARHQSGRNSGVVHSGLYYRPGSSKARLVARGRGLLVERARLAGVPVEVCGKVVVATRSDQLGRLRDLERNATANRVEARRVAGAELRRLEPHVRGVAALHVPSAAITDFGALARRWADEVVEAGGRLLLGDAVTGISQLGDGRGLSMQVGSATLTTRWLVNCAGLHSDRVARMAGHDPGVRIVPFRGEYHELAPAARGLVRNLVYPVPDPRWPFLGVHLTRMSDGGVHVGPNALLALGREAYEGGVDRTDAAELLRTIGLWRLGSRYWRTGATELARSRSTRLLLAEVRRLVPHVRADDLVPAGAGIRAQAIRRDGTLVDDFEFGVSPCAVHVLNAPSPAATASPAIAEVVVDRLDDLRAGPG